MGKGPLFFMPSPQSSFKNFSKSGFSFPLPYLLQVQHDSWNQFWAGDFKELLQEISPIRDHTKKEFELWFLDFKMGSPNYATDLEAKENDDSFEAPLRVKVRLVNLKTKEQKEQEIFLADFPLMTERGTFIINGVERVAISQLIRSPGAFFTGQNVTATKKIFGAKIIPNRGAWLELETESSGFIGVRIDRKRKAPITTLLKAFGLETKEAIEAALGDVDTGEISYITETLKKDTTTGQGEALMEIYRRLRPGDYVTPETAKELIWNMFFNFERYDLSRVGRWKTLQRLPALQQKGQKGKEGSIEDRVLKVDDVVQVLREVIRLNNTPGAQPDQIDHLGNRRVRTFAEFLQNRLRVGFMRMERIVKDRMSTLDSSTITPAQLVNPRPVMAIIKEFFTSSQITQFMDNENPLAELEHKRRVSATGPGGLTRERAGFEVRDVQPSHYGRICPIQTPEGPNIGLVGHMASYARINSYGFLETPYFKVEKGRVTNDLVYLNAFQEEQEIIAHAGTPLDGGGKILEDKVEARVKGEPGVVQRSDITFFDVAPEQSISVATALIPFLRNDDANRALMGSNMQRQAVPLLRPESPLVGTGLEEKVAKDSGLSVVAKEEGVVKEVDAKHITIKPKNGKTQRYNLKNFVRTNQYTSFHQRPIVDVAGKVKKGQIIADGGAIAKGRLALGTNLLVAFVPWRGGNYEDAIIISERLVREDAYTSIHIEDFVADIRETKLGPEVTTADIPNVGEEKLKDLDEEGVVRVGAEVGPNDILVGKISPKGEADLTAEERLLRAIFGEKARDVKDSSLFMPHGKRGRVVAVKVFERAQGHKLEPGVIKRIHVEVAELRKVQPGDKLAGRHGNKGVISFVLPEEDMPFMEDGTPVDIVLNPLGVASRMNIGQILETHLGWAAKEGGYYALTPGLAGATEEDIKRELQAVGLPEDGKVTLFDGRDGKPFPQRITVGMIYMMKLIHMVEDKIHMRSIGPYSLITQQPLGGKAQFGGQRFGEMEVWALEGYGAAHALQEMLTIKSDDVPGRASTYESILRGQAIQTPNLPASFSLLLAELRSLGLNIEVKESKGEVRNPKSKTDSNDNLS